MRIRTGQLSAEEPLLLVSNEVYIKHGKTYSKVTSKDELPAEEHRGLSL